MTIFYHNQTYESFACQCLQIINPPKKTIETIFIFMEKAYLGMYVVYILMFSIIIYYQYSLFNFLNA